MPVTAIFLDSAGVLFDKDALGREWIRTISEALASQLGGDVGAWKRASVTASVNAMKRHEARMRKDGGGGGAKAFLARDRVSWLLEACDAMHISPPADAEILAEEITRGAGSRVDAALPGAADRIRELRDAGFTLFTASSQASLELTAQLRSLGIRELFDHTYGPDLVDRWKTGPHYYEAILKDAIVKPESAAVVDDGSERLDWARKRGVRTFLMVAAPQSGPHTVIRSLSELPALLR